MIDAQGTELWHVFYLVGSPGSGKTTLMREALKGLLTTTAEHPFAHTLYTPRYMQHTSDQGLGAGEPGVQLGADRATFGGTDALPMNVQPQAVKWLKEVASRRYPVILAEGDRLANTGFFEACEEAGYVLTVAFLDTPEYIAADRRAKRAQITGKAQNPTWVSGRITKAEKLASRYTPMKWWLDGRLTMRELTEHVHTHPAFRYLHGSALRGTGTVNGKEVITTPR